MGNPLLVELFQELPQSRAGDSLPNLKAARFQKALDQFREKVKGRYSEATLQRLLESRHVPTRRAAVLALGLMGTMDSNRAVAARLHDEDRVVRLWTVDSLWSLWFQADTSANNQELRRLMGIGDPHDSLVRLDELVRQAPCFAEAYNQRAILYFRLKQYHKSIVDCETVIRLNPFHFGAQAGMAQCYMKLKKPGSALKAFRIAHDINPELAGVQETIQFLEEYLGDDSKK